MHHKSFMTNYQNLISKIPKEVSRVTQTLEKASFEAFLVGGCVRDLVMGKEPKDWDVTTNAKPEQIMELFEKTVYENAFGTVGVIVSRETEPNLVIEITPYRIEEKYSDFRHPDEVKFSEKLEDDLKRRDFTVNALALGKGLAQSIKDIESDWHLTDMFGGLKDIENKTLRTVGEPEERFREDALRMIRAVRFSLQLGFSVAHEASESIAKNADLIQKISRERVRDEFKKIIMADTPAAGVLMLSKFGLLKHIIPELLEGIGVEQSGEHVYNVWEHLLQALQHAADKNWPLEIRLAALFHDIGKPKTRRNTPTQPPPTVGGGERRGYKKYTFYGHEVVGARMTKKIMERLKFANKEIELTEKLVRNHMFFSDPEKITLSAVRRIIVKVGRGNIWDLMNVRECDRVGMRKKEKPYRLRKYFAMIEEALRDPISVGQLTIDGNFMQKELGISPGPRMGWILHALLEEVLDAPEKNTVEHLSELTKSLNMLGDAELRALGERGREKKEELEDEEVAKLHQKHGVD